MGLYISRKEELRFEHDLVAEVVHAATTDNASPSVKHVSRRPHR